MNIYALYKGDDLLAMRTKKEIAEIMGLKHKTVIFYGTPTYKKRIVGRKDRRELIFVGKE